MTIKSDEINNQDTYAKLFAACPYAPISKFEFENFHLQSGSAYPRFIIDVINQIRKIDSDLTSITTPFEINVLQEKRSNLIAILDNQNIDELTSAIENWEIVESDYWVNYLGKKAAIEILTLGKATVDTMTAMVKLPEELYIKSTQICVRLANTISDATVSAEQEIGVGVESDAATTETKKVILNKIK
jgi:hypothetical protein